MSIEVNTDIPAVLKDYILLSHKPQINGIELSGNKTSAELNIKEVISAQINANGHLILTLNDNSTVDCGDAKGDTGAAGADGTWNTETITGTTLTVADRTEYRAAEITEFTITYPSGDFECWLRLSCADSGTVGVTFPSGTTYIGDMPTFANGETWEISIKDGVVIAARVGG